MGSRLESWDPTRRADASPRGTASRVRLALFLAVALLVAGGLLGVLGRSRVASSAPDHLGTGVVVSLLPPPSSLHASRPVIIIHHDPIPGLMEHTMSMPFIAASPGLLDGLRPGDRIRFGIKVTREAILVISLERSEPGRTR